MFKFTFHRAITLSLLLQKVCFQLYAVRRNILREFIKRTVIFLRV